MIICGNESENLFKRISLSKMWNDIRNKGKKTISLYCFKGICFAFQNNHLSLYKQSNENIYRKSTEKVYRDEVKSNFAFRL